MSDLISREDAIKPFCTAPDGTRIPEVDCDNFPVEFSVEFIKKHLLSLPSADRPSGEWQRVDEQPYFRKHYHKVCCSICHKRGNEKYNYCPNCGAKMKAR